MLKSGYTLGSDSYVSVGKRLKSLRIFYFRVSYYHKFRYFLGGKKEIRSSETGHDIISIFWGLGLNLVRLVALDTEFLKLVQSCHSTSGTDKTRANICIEDINGDSPSCFIFPSFYDINEQLILLSFYLWTSNYKTQSSYKLFRPVFLVTVVIDSAAVAVYL